MYCEAGKRPDYSIKHVPFEGHNGSIKEWLEKKLKKETFKINYMVKYSRTCKEYL